MAEQLLCRSTTGKPLDKRVLVQTFRDVGRSTIAHKVVMKNITLNAGENVPAAVRRYAAARNSSVNVLARE